MEIRHVQPSKTHQQRFNTSNIFFIIIHTIYRKHGLHINETILHLKIILTQSFKTHQQWFNTSYQSNIKG